MDNNFRSTVLQRPGGDEDERDRHHRRDMMTAGNTHRHSTFSLRSPTQSEFHQPPPFTSPNRSANTYMSSSTPASGSAGAGGPVAPTLPPPGPPSSSSSAAVNHHQAHPPVSPLHPPSGYYPPPSSSSSSSAAARDKPAGGSFYDPTTDTTKERRVSDSWHGASHAATTPKVSRQSTSFFP